MQNFVKSYSNDDIICANFVRDVRLGNYPVDTKTSGLSETGQFMSSTYYVPVRNRKILASTYLTNESVRQGVKKSRLFNFFRSIETTI